jgi:hypothetical protein
VEFNPSPAGNARFSPLVNAAGAVIPTLYAGTTLDCALMETVFHDVPFVAGPKIWSKATHVAGKVYSQLILDGPWLCTTNIRMLWASRQADPARALVLFQDHLTAPALTASGVPTSLLLSDGSAMLKVLMLAQRLGVLLTP